MDRCILVSFYTIHKLSYQVSAIKFVDKKTAFGCFSCDTVHILCPSHRELISGLGRNVKNGEVKLYKYKGWLEERSPKRPSLLANYV